mmetsp:Transcript_20955/g.54028  ORF Transcript_20955/g.54028 Transcript_20955/m.54028 type:complete len:248 (+) Transcript_20955:1169-1912(+)
MGNHEADRVRNGRLPHCLHMYHLRLLAVCVRTRPSPHFVESCAWHRQDASVSIPFAAPVTAITNIIARGRHPPLARVREGAPPAAWWPRPRRSKQLAAARPGLDATGTSLPSTPPRRWPVHSRPRSGRAFPKKRKRWLRARKSSTRRFERGDDECAHRLTTSSPRAKPGDRHPAATHARAPTRAPPCNAQHGAGPSQPVASRGRMPRWLPARWRSPVQMLVRWLERGCSRAGPWRARRPQRRTRRTR